MCCLDHGLQIDAQESKEENVLASFYIENDDYAQLCQVSLVPQDGWKPISIMVDSGACDCMAPPDTFPGIPVVPTTASRDGLEYTAAGVHKFANLGMSRPVVFTTDEECNAMTFQIAAISKPLGAALGRNVNISCCGVVSPFETKRSRGETGDAEASRDKRVNIRKTEGEENEIEKEENEIRCPESSEDYIEPKEPTAPP